MDAPTPQPAPPPFKPMTLALAAAGLGLTALLPLAAAQRPEYQVWNASVIGALALFSAARLGFWQGVAFTAVAIALKDVSVYLTSNWWQPYPLSWLYFTAYALIGRAALRRSESAGRIAGAALGASLFFFFVSNFVSWLEQALPYGYSLQGLLDCFAGAVPFYRGTLVGDLAFSATLFGAHAVLSRAYFPLERVAPERAEAERVDGQNW